MAIIERDINKSVFVDKEELRRLIVEQNKRMGFVRVPDATAQKARELMRAAGIRPEDNEATRELLSMRYGGDYTEE